MSEWLLINQEKTQTRSGGRGRDLFSFFNLDMNLRVHLPLKQTKEKLQL